MCSWWTSLGHCALGAPGVFIAFFFSDLAVQSSVLEIKQSGQKTAALKMTCLQTTQPPLCPPFPRLFSLVSDWISHGAKKKKMGAYIGNDVYYLFLFSLIWDCICGAVAEFTKDFGSTAAKAQNILLEIPSYAAAEMRDIHHHQGQGCTAHTHSPWCLYYNSATHRWAELWACCSIETDSSQPRVSGCYCGYRTLAWHFCLAPTRIKYDG